MICPHVFTGSERLRWIYADISPHCSCMSFPALDNCRNYSKQLSFFLTVISELYFTVLPLMAARLLSPESTRCLAAVGYPQSSLTFIMWHVRVYITAPLPNIPTGRWDSVVLVLVFWYFLTSLGWALLPVAMCTYKTQQQTYRSFRLLSDKSIRRTFPMSCFAL